MDSTHWKREHNQILFSQRNRVNGFTLLEVLIAISLLMLVIAVAGMAMRMGLNAVRAGEGKIEALERFRSSLCIVLSQIGSEIPLTIKNGEEKKIVFQGSKDSLLLATGFSIWKGQCGYVAVQYQVTPDKKGKVALKATENIIGFQKSMETTLFSELDHISFEYLAPRDEKNSENIWKDEWADDKNIPEKIKMNLGYKGDKYTFILPMRARSQGN